MSVIRFTGQRFKGYYTVEEAKDAWEHANAVGNIGPITTTPAGPSTRTAFNHVLSDEEAYWVILQGRRPGVYCGLWVPSTPLSTVINLRNWYTRKAARVAGGKVNGKVCVVRALTKDEACRAFTENYMKGRVAALA